MRRVKRAATAPGDRTPAGSAVTSVAATASQIVVTGRLAAADDPAGTSLALYALDPAQDEGSYASLTPVATLAGPGAGFHISAPRFQGGRDGYYDKYLVVADTLAGIRPLGTSQYPAADFPAQYDYPYPSGWDKKGLSAVQMTDDADSLGASSSVVNVVLNDLMLASDTNPADTIAFRSNGQDYYFNAAAVASLDQQLAVLTKDRIYPYLILLVTPHDPANSAGPELRFPGAAAAASIDAFNTETPQGIAYLTAAAQFLSGRYLRSDARDGQAAGYIVGNEVDSAWVWQNMGQQTLTSFLEYYARAVRIFYQAARVEYPQPHVYISLDHEWAVPYQAGEPLEYYPGQQVVDGLAALTRAEGDFPSDIAHHPYPQNLFNPEFWNDTDATNSPDTQLITFKNLQVLTQYLTQPAVTYDGEPRRVILSEQGFNTPQLPAVAAHRRRRVRLRVLQGPGPARHRRVHAVPARGQPGRGRAAPGRVDLGPEQSLRVTNFALPIIGITSWSQVIPGFDPAALAQRPLPATAGTEVAAVPNKERAVATFDTETDGWQPAENADAVTTAAVPGYGSGHALVVHFDDTALLPPWSTETMTAKGADVVFRRPVNAASTPWLDLAVNVPAPAFGPFQADDTFRAIVKVYGSDNQVTIGTAGITLGSGWVPLSVDLSGWPEASSVKRIQVWVQGRTDESSTGSYDIGQVGFSTTVSPAATLSPGTASLAGLGTGQSRSFIGTLTSYTASANPVLCLAYDGETFTVPLVIPPPAPHTLYSFSAGATDGWADGQNVAAVAAVAGFPDGPGTPYESTYALNATGIGVAADAPKTVTLSQAATIQHDSWNQVSIDVSSWPYRDDITGVSVSMAATGSSTPWTADFQLDDVGYTS